MLSALRPAALRPVGLRHFRLRCLFLILLLNLSFLASLGLSPAALAQATSVISVNTGGGAAGNFAADGYYSGGSTDTQTGTINTSGVTNPAPPAVYLSERWGNFTYTLPGLTPSGYYTVRLHFAEVYYGPGMPGGGGTGTRQFNVAVNGTQVLSNFDIFAAAGGADIAVVKAYPATADVNGNITVAFTQGAADNAKVSGIEVFAAVPAAPTALTATAGNASVALSWSAPGGAVTGYNIYRSTTSGTGYTKVNTSAVMAASYTDTGVTNGTTYYYVVTAVNSAGESAYSASAIATPSAQPAAAVLSVNAGGGAAGSFAADSYYSGGNVDSVANPISISGVTNPAPQAVYQSERWGSSFNYTLPGLVPSGFYTVRLHFVETNFGPGMPSGGGTGSRQFNTSINGTQVLTNFDIFAAAGGADIAIAKTYSATADGNGNITVTFSQGAANFPKVNGIEVLTTSPMSSAAPTALAATAGNASVALSWTASAGPAISYNIYRATASGGPYVKSEGSVANVNYTDTGLTNGTTYYYVVTAVNSIGESAYSNPANATPSNLPAALLSVNAGGGSVGNFAADEFSQGGTTDSQTGAINTSGVTNPAPQAVYQSERWGNFTYTLPGFTPGGPYTIRLHFAETFYGPGMPGGGGAGTRQFNVAVNGTQVLTNFDIFAAAGGADIAIAKTYSATADGNGNITVTFSQGAADNAKVSGIEVFPGAPTGLTLTPAGVAVGFSLTTFATGFPQVGQIGPLGAALVGSSGVMVADYAGNVRLFPRDTDGQVAGNFAPAVPSVTSFGSLNADGLASLGGTFYLAQPAAGQVIRLNPNGTPVTGANAVAASIASATGIVANPATGHLFVSGGDNSTQIWDVNPTTNTASSWIAVQGADGMAVSADGRTLYAALGSDILGFDVASRTQVWDYNATASHIPIANMDGIALGFGTLAGKIYTNTNDGTVWQISLASGAATEIASGGTRGDFVAPDVNGQGSLLLTQSDRIMRLAPFPISGSGTVTLSSLTVNPGTVTGGQSTTGTVTLTGNAPVGGCVIALSSNQSAVSVPTSVTVPAGQTSISFTATTSPVAKDTNAIVTAVYGTTKTAPLTVKAPILVGLILNPSTVVGMYSSQATATISNAAPASGLVLQLSSTNPAATVPATVTVAAGSSSVSFRANTVPVASTTTSTIAAAVNGSSASAQLTINPPSCVASPISNFTVLPASLSAGASLTGTVTLATAAQNGGETINLVCDVPNALAVPATVFIPAGSVSNTFTATAQSIPVATMAHIFASYHDTVWTATVNIAASASGGGGSGNSQHICGPMDVVFVLDSTGSMGTALGSVKSGLTSIISQIQAASGGDYRLGLLNFWNDVEVLDPLAAGNTTQVQADINAMSASGGGNYPQSSDVAALTAISALPASYWIPGGLLQGSNPAITNPTQAIASPKSALQTGDFTTGWRPGAQKIVILVTDAPPAEFNNGYGSSSASLTYAHYVALQAQSAGVLICAVNVAGNESDISAVMQDYAGTSGGVYAFCQGGTGTGDALVNIINRCGNTLGAAAGNIIATRDDQRPQYTPFSITSTVASPSVTASSAKAAGFDLVGFSGILTAANVQRSGQLAYTNDGTFDIQWGLRSIQTGGPISLSATQTAANLATSDPYIYSVNWPVSGPFLTELGNSLGGDYSAYLTDLLSSACGTYNIADTAHQNWPYQKNILTLQISPTSGIIGIPAGRCLDLTLPGTDAPDNNAHWDILLNGQVVGSSGNPQGWDVEADHTLYYGVTVTVPATASASSNYEVRFVRQGMDDPYQSSGSGGFSVTSADTTTRAPLLRPLVLSLTGAAGAAPIAGVTGTATIAGTVSLDAPAPQKGATVVLTSSSSYAAVGFPGYVVILPGKISASFTITTQSVNSLTPVQILASYNGYRVASMTLRDTNGSAPNRPALTAVPSDHLVLLAWTSSSSAGTSSSAITYTVSRSTHKGGPYTPIFSGLTATMYSDRNVTNGTTYYYVVTAVNDYGSAQSLEASATPSGGQLSPPTFGSNPPGFTAQGSIQAIISDAALATIHYTLDGSAPNANSPVYSGPITLTAPTTTVTAIATRTGFAPSAIASQQYTVTGLQSVVTTPTSCGGTIAGTLSASDGWSLVHGVDFYARDYYFTGTVGTTITLSVQPGTPPLDAVLFLVAPTGQVIYSNSNGSNPQITVTLPATGLYTAEVSSYAPLETGAYTITLSCNVPQLTILSNSQVLTSGTTTVTASTIPFGSVAVGSSLSQTLTFKNTGAAELDPTLITVPDGFSLTQAPISPIQPGQMTTMVLSFAPTAAQTYSGSLQIASNDPASPFTITLTGTGTGTGSTTALASLKLTPDPVIGGQTVAVTVTLANAAPAGGNGVPITLTKVSDPSSAAGLPVPVILTVPAGQLTQTYTLTTSAVFVPATVTLSATDGTNTAQGLLTVQPTPLQSPKVVLTSPTDKSQFAAGTPIALAATATAPSGTIVKVEFWASVNGATNAKIGQATTSPYTFVWPGVAGEQNASFTAMATDSNGLSATSAPALVTFTSPVLASLQMSPDPVTGGKSVTGTVTLAAPAPAGGAVVALTKAADAGNVVGLPSPASVTVAAGATTATFMLTTTSVTAQASAVISASLGGGTASVTLIVTPALPSAGPTLASLRLSPDPVQGGQTVVGTVTLSGPAAAATTINLAKAGDTNNVVGLPSPASVTVQPGQTTATFTLTTTNVTTQASTVITASLGTSTASVTLVIYPAPPAAGPALASLQLSPDPVQGGQTVTGTVTLTGPATAATTVSLTKSGDSSNVVGLPSPASVTVSVGATTATFTLTTTSVTASTSVVIMSSSGGQSAPVTLVISPTPPASGPALASLQLAPDPVIGGNFVTGTVTLTATAAADTIVNLTTSDSVNAQLPSPAQVIVPAGKNTATFIIATQVVSASVSPRIGAALGGGSATVTLVITPAPPPVAPAIASLQLAPDPVTGGTAVTGTVTLAVAAPAGGTLVSLTTTDATNAALPSPATVLVPVGQTKATFSITTQPVAAQVTPSIGASSGGGTASAVLVINPPLLTSLSLSPNPVAGGQTVTGTVTLTGPAPTNGLVVTLTKAADPGNVLGLPASVTILANAATANFPLTTTGVTNPASFVISAGGTAGTPAATATLVVNPAAALTLACGQTVSGSLSTSDSASTHPAFAGSGTHYAKRYTFTPTVSGNYILIPTASGFDPAVSLISSSGYVVSPSAGQAFAAGQPYLFYGQAVFTLTAGTAYAFEISTASAGQIGTFQLRLTCPQSTNTASLLVKANGGTVVNDPPLTGTAFNFGTTLAGAPISQVFTLSNAGNTDLGITSIVTNGDYQIIGNVPTLVPAGGQAILTVQFNASSAGTALGNVIITDDAPASSTYQFRTTATANSATSGLPTLTLTPTPTSVTGGASLTETITLSASSSSNLTVTLSSDNPAATMPGSVQVAAGQTTAQVTVRTSVVSAQTLVNLRATLGSSVGAAALTVNPTGTPPTVSLVSDKATAVAPGSFTLTATASAATGAAIAKVEFYAANSGKTTKIGEGVASSTTPNTYVLNWNNVPASTNAYTLTAKATDSRSLTTPSTSVSVTVTTPAAAQTLAVVISPVTGNYAAPLSVTLAATDGTGRAVAAAQIYYALDGTSTTPGTVWKLYTQGLTLVQSGTVWAKAVAAGYASSPPVSATYTLNPVSGGSLTAQMSMTSSGGTAVSSANPAQTLTISAPTPVVASISAASSWQLAYRLDGDNGWVPFAAGSTGAAVSSTSLATWDTTLLVNGLYQVQLTAVDTSGHSATAQIEVLVQGGQKVGYFTLSYNDLTVPVAGFPLSITRTYDSRVKTPGDFGVGWTLSTNNLRLQQSSPSGYNWTQVGQPGQTLYFNPVKPHILTLTMPDGTAYSFQEGLAKSSFGVFDQSDLNGTTVVYTPLPGTRGALAPVGYGTEVVLALDSSHSDDPNASDPNDIELEDLEGNVYKPTEFLLTTRDGRKFDVFAGSPQQGGGLQFIKDLNGNTLTFQHTGNLLTSITSSTSANTGIAISGPAITFQRTGPNNTITSINVSGQTEIAITYVQDGNGDLKSVADRVGNRTTYHYDPTHLLTSIDDPRGLTPLRNYYDANGRLSYSLDALGHQINYAYDPNLLVPGSHTETTTDRLLNQTALTYDGYGNVTSTTRTLMKIDGVTPDHSITTTMAYANFGGNNPDKKTSEVVQVDNNGLKRQTDYQYDPVTGDLLTVTQYRTNGDPTSAITTTTTYNGLGQPLTVTDPLGHVVSKNNYYPNGNLMWTQDALHNQTDFTYNPNGTLATTKDAKGNITQYAYNDPLNPANVTTVTDAQSHTTSFTYDLDGNKKTQTTSRLNGQGQTEPLITKFNYDNDDHLTQTIAPDGATSQTFYTSLGKVDYTLDPLGRRTLYNYDNLGQLISTTYPDSTTTSVTYDNGGQRIASTDKAGRVSATFYDSLGRVIQSGPSSASWVPDPTGHTLPTWLTSGSVAQVSKTVYDDAGEVTAETDALGHTSQTAYDNLGRTHTSTDALNHTTTYAYDDDGRQLSVTDANNHKTIYDYDDAGRLTVTHYPDGITTSITGYDELGRRISQTDQAGHTTQYDYDTLGRLFTITDPMSHITQFGYDALGEKISQTDANGHITQFAYDNRGRLLSKLLPMGQADGRTYDALGRLQTQTDFGGKMTTFGYDPLSGRLMSKTASIGGTPTGESVSFTYNTDGTRATATRTAASGVSIGTAYAYYPSGDYRQGELQSVSTQVGSGPVRVIIYDYDLLGNKASTLTPGGSKVVYGYDALNRLLTVTHPDGAVTTFGYDRVGNRQSVTRQDATPAHMLFSTTAYTYDLLNRLTDIVNQAGSGALVSSYHYGLRLDGKRFSVMESGPYTSKGTTTYTYDDSGKLTQEAGPYATIAYGYDNVGNRLTRTVTNAATGNGTTLTNGTTTNTYDLNDRIATVNGSATHSYDADGNETTVNGQAASYDFENHLILLGSVASYVYDADGNRVSVSSAGTTTDYAVDTSLPYASVIEEYAGGSATPSARYDYGDDLVRMDRGSGVYYYIYDGLGSTRQLVNTAGAVTDSYGYSAFGEMTVRTGSTQNLFLFNAQQFDGASGDYFLRARYYDQSNGRFISQDPLQGNNEDPITLHRYLYAGVDPISNVDPSGKAFFGITYDDDPNIGSDAEGIIKEKYGADYPDDVISYGGRQYFDSTGWLGHGFVPNKKWFKPDVFNSTAKKFLEIKPFTLAKVSLGFTQRQNYITAFSPSGFEPQADWDPPAEGLGELTGRTFYFFNVFGIIFYTTEQSEVITTGFLGTLGAGAAKSLMLKSMRYDLRELVRTRAQSIATADKADIETGDVSAESTGVLSEGAL